ncbi:hypothetical protein RMATCC62417_11731 [Rhizopus microsporus]|nr:hypothetical protein RMATCC62417_11731 [Rhizopus microsporus]
MHTTMAAIHNNNNNNNMMEPPAYNNQLKDLFRHSVASTATTVTSTSNSTQRLSTTSLSEDDYCPRHSTSSSHHSHHSSSNNHSIKSKILSKIQSKREENAIAIDPWCISVRYALEHSICSDWMYKYETPTFTFTKSWKKRYFVLVDRIVYVFKSTKPTSPAKEHFVLTADTFVFVTEEFKKGYVIELRKPHFKWYIRCDSVNQMKQWLELMKKTVACIKIGYNGLLTHSILSSIKLTDDYKILIPQSYPKTRPSSHYSRRSMADIPDWETMIIPPQLPPPRTKPPPVPLPTVSE